MAEPKVRFRQDDGTQYPALRNAAMGDYYTERNERGEKGLPMLTVSIHSGISDGELDEEELGKRVNRSADVSLYKKAVKGDLVFNMMRAWQGAVGSTKSTGMVSPAYIVASPNKEIDPTFMNYYVQTKTIINRFNRLSYGALDFRKRLYWDSFIAAEVNIPVIEEQQKIADFLSSVDEVIAASEQEVTNLQMQKKVVMKKIFSQEVRFKKDDGTDYPEWEEKPFYDCVDISADMVQPDVKLYGDLPHIGPGNIEKGTGHLAEYKLVKDEDLISGKYLFSETDIIYGKINPQLMKVAYPRFKGLCSADAYPISAHSDVMLPEFLLYSLLDSRFVKYSVSVSMRTGMPKINRDELGYYMFRIPTLEEQRLIADFLSSFDEAIAAAKKELELWKELKKGLLQQMFV